MPPTSSRRSNRLLPVIGFFIICSGLVLVAYVARTVWRAALGLNNEIATAIVAAAATILVSVFTLIWSKLWERRLAIEQEQRLQKIPVYEEFMSFWIKVLFSSKPGQPGFQQEEMIEFFKRFTQKLVIWGSDEVILAYIDFRVKSLAVANGTGTNPLETMLSLERLLLAFRKDLGHGNQALPKGSILRMFVTDLKDPDT